MPKRKFSVLIGFFVLSICINKKFTFNTKKDIGDIKFHKDGHEERYINKFNEMKKEYSKNSFFRTFLEEISLISYDYINSTNNQNNKIHIMVNLDNKYIYPLIVSITSALTNAKKNKTTLIYHILCSKNLKKGNIYKLKSLLLIFPYNLEMIFYNMGNAFIKYKYQKYSQVTYYRLISPIFLPIDRIIYLDCDVLIFNDLYEMYQTPFKNNYILGFLDILSGGIDYLGIPSEKYINAGVLLMNLEKIRKDNKHFELLYMAKYHKKLKHQDQTVINYILYPYIGLLPFKFGLFNFPSVFDIKYIYLKNIRQKLNLSELIDALNNPSIIHFVLCYPKIWRKNTIYNGFSTRNGTIYRSSCENFHRIWILYAKKTLFYDEIMKKYNL